MLDNKLFEYAIIRLVPEVHKSEFINVGVVLFCKEHAFLGMKYALNKNRIKALFKNADLEEIESHLKSFSEIAKGNIKGRGIESLDTASRFRWLIAKRSTIIQTSDVHPGSCISPEKNLEMLFKEQVLE